MPILGFTLQKLSDIISKYQHFVALFLLGAIGINLIIEAIKESKHRKVYALKKYLYSQKSGCTSFATSIDALAVGVSLAPSTQVLLQHHYL